MVAVRLVDVGWNRDARWERVIGTASLRRAFEHSPYGRALDVLLAGTVPLAAALLGVWLLRRWLHGERRIAVAGLAAVGGAVGTTELLKLVLAARPGVPHKFAHGFPSGHTTAACATALAFAVAAGGRNRLVPAAAFVAFVAGGVVLDGWHLPSDAAGGLCMASAWVLGLLALVDPPRDVRIGARDVARAAAATAVVAAVLLLAHLAVPAHGPLLHQSVEAVVVLTAAAFGVTVLAVYASTARSVSTTRS